MYLSASAVVSSAHARRMRAPPGRAAPCLRLLALLSLLLAATLAAAFDARFASAQSDASPSSSAPPAVRVSAVGSASIQPSVLAFTYTVIGEGGTPSAAQRDGTEQQRATDAAIDELVEGESPSTSVNASTERVSLRENFDFVNGSRVSTGWRYEQQTSVRVPDIALGTEIIGAVVSASRSVRVNGVDFDASAEERASASATARERALSNAQRVASESAQTLECEAGAPRIIAVSAGSPPGGGPVPLRAESMAANVVTAPPPSVEPGHIDVVQSALVEFALSC